MIGHVEDMAERLEILRLWREYDLAHKRTLSTTPEADALYDEYQKKLVELRQWHDEERKKLSGPSLYSLVEELEAAQKAYFAAPKTIRETDDGDPVVCAVTGAPIYEEDEVVETESGRLILASAFIPRSILDQFKESDDDDEDEASDLVEDAA